MEGMLYNHATIADHVAAQNGLVTHLNGLKDQRSLFWPRLRISGPTRAPTPTPRPSGPSSSPTKRSSRPSAPRRRAKRRLGQYRRR